MLLAEQIAKTLDVLRGKPLTDVGRAANMHMFGFGSLRTVKSRLGRGDAEVAEFALHIQCTWRIRSDKTILVASRDQYYPKGDWTEVDESFDWDRPGVNRCDELTSNFLRDYCPILVEEIAVDQVGGFQLNLERRITLEAFLDNSMEIEHWRLFRTGEEIPHAVFVGNRFEND